MRRKRLYFSGRSVSREFKTGVVLALAFAGPLSCGPNSADKSGEKSGGGGANAGPS